LWVDGDPPHRNWVTRPEFVGIENIPLDDRPLLFVGNHTLYGLFDMPLMIYEIRKKTGLTLRGLAHPLHYMSAFGDLLARYGAVKVGLRFRVKVRDACPFVRAPLSMSPRSMCRCRRCG